MRLRLVTVGTRMPDWVSEGYRDYARRLPKDCTVELVELPLGRRGKNPDIARAIEQEGQAMLGALKPGETAVALDVKGKAWSTEQLAEQLAGWRMDGADVSLLVGGPDGLAPEVLARADRRWSLSPLTLPHPLVRLVLIEQIYRAWTILVNHPYHK